MEIILIIGITIIIFGIWIYIETNKIEKREYEIKSKKIPESMSGYKICFVSDLHIKNTKKGIADRVVEKINKEDANIVILGGDYIYRNMFKYRKEKNTTGLKKDHGEEYKVKMAWEVLSKLDKKEGVYAVLGNHDYWQPKAQTLDEIKKAGFIELDNKACWIEKNGEKIRLGGVSDIGEDMSDVTKTTDEVDSQYTILISHSPVIALLEKPGMEKVDLLLSGHLHGGQISFFGLWAPLVPSAWGHRKAKGKTKIDNLDIVISAGIGTSFLPIRFFARPDYTVITLRREEDA